MKKYVRRCREYQYSKDSRSKQFGEPQPLQILNRRWGSVATHFITYLPKTKNGYNTFMTFADWFTKRLHFIPSKDKDDAPAAAKAFFQNVLRLDRRLDSIVSDRHPKFTSKFWSEFLKLCDVEWKISTAYHPQTDDSAEIINRILENYLRYFCNFQQNN